AFFDRVVNGMLWILSRPVLGLLLLEIHLLLRDSQRAEFLADALAARTAGTNPVISLQEKLLLNPSFRYAMQRAAQDRSGAADVLTIFESTVATAPERERERRRRVARLEVTRLSSTHPPTSRRIELLAGRRQPSAGVELSP